MSKLIVANWKMYLSHNESIIWLTNQYKEIDQLLALSRHTLVICPLYTVLAAASTLSSDNILWGAQDCSFKDSGAVTGDISAQSLKELHCSYAIVGHAERRLYYPETNDRLESKIHLLLLHTIQPVFCIGENTREASPSYNYVSSNKLSDAIKILLKDQLQPIIKTYLKRDTESTAKISPGNSASNGQMIESTEKTVERSNSIIIAYEPVWAIGTGVTPTAQHIEATTKWIRSYIRDQINITTRVLYGGSLNEHNAAKLLSETTIDGFLLGKASTDFQTLKKIIISC